MCLLTALLQIPAGFRGGALRGGRGGRDKGGEKEKRGEDRA